MRLNELRDNPNARKSRTRIGRGIGSGKGKTAGRGHKGQKSRSGVAIKGFEGGQMPIHMRLPKRGFNNFTRKDFAELTLGNLQNAITKGLIDKNKAITEVELNAAGIVKKSKAGIKLLNKGELKDKIEISLSKATKSCINIIEGLGGKVSVLEVPKVKRVRKKDDVSEEKKEIKVESVSSSQDSEEVKNKEVAESSTQETADK
ncbi:MAG: 50S ribosomal protein L15 [Alphaproteobacteria bacterium]|jgi:large subunit ribosomal protein L15|nr:50S ribosomal protein L15 [Rhodobiaceae bacterium]PDH51855.1 MAG: 50S ribosomal protein L15 [alpha proteobacterium MED-G09]|tara:strand:- start:3739 stop:4347 length:609 start_codon:yes stop_codon:yes gene_type:complete